MKRILFTLSVLLISSCINVENLKKEVKEEIIEELEDYRDVTKGDGYYFYNEPVSIGGNPYYKHHSTLDCPEIKNGVQRDCYKLDAYHNLFCSRCMDDELISKWNDWAFPDGYKKK